MSDSEEQPRRKAGGRQTKSDQELEQRVEFTALLLGRDLPKSEIKRVLKSKYSCSAQTCESYISKARALLIEWSGQTKDELFVESVSFWRSIIQGPRSKDGDRMRARERLDALYALEPPRQVHAQLTGPNGGPVEIEQQVYFFLPYNERDGLPEGAEVVGDPNAAAVA